MKSFVRWLVVATIATVFLAPLAALFQNVDLVRARAVVTAAGFLKVLAVTAGTGAGGALLSVAIGFAFARPFALNDWAGKRPQRLLLLAPYLLPNFILATAYVIAWNPGTGLLGAYLPLPFELYGVPGMTLLFAVAAAPVAFLMLEGKLTRLDPTLREAARLAGASPLAVARRIELPLVLPTLASAFALCLALNLSAFAIPAWIGAPARVYPLTYKIYQAIQVGGASGIPDAAVLALALFAMVLPVLGLLSLAQRRERRFATLSGKPGRAGVRRAGGWPFRRFQAWFWLYVSGTFLAPMACLAVSTVTPPGCLQRQGLGCVGALTLHAYRYALFDLAETRLAFIGSGVYGTLSAVLILVIATLTLMALSGAGRALKAASAVFTLLMATPGALIALGLIVALSGRFGLNLYNSPWIVVVAMLLKHMNLAFQPLRTGLNNITGTLFEAARLAGARPAAVWRRIALPLLSPECLGGFFLVLIPILGELTMSIFLASPSYRSLGTVLFDLSDYADFTSAGALSMTLFAVILLVNEAARLTTRGRVGY